ncbi:hypothetical protein AV530_005749 [Patagioenas fasciata monilis]|uniref:Uncharacterized protein n=1 Tax=Patagioenas fasciata monilis TaxID=372326 RepID=A0A1V4JMG9_PATFA|nr:hypothetical protein AV530_005749 [Patagioenas fasciata monilis]
MPQECAEVCASFQKWIPFLAGAEQRIYHPVAAVHLPCSFVTAYEGKLRVGNSPLLSSRLRRGSSHLEKVRRLRLLLQAPPESPPTELPHHRPRHPAASLEDSFMLL